MNRLAPLCMLLMLAASTGKAQIPETPGSRITDPAGTLDTPRLESLQDRIERTLTETGISLFIVTYESLPENELASARASQILTTWGAAEMEAVIVYVEDTRRLAVATSRTATAEDEDGALRTIAPRANSRLEDGGDPAQILRETALELDYVLRTIHRRMQSGFFTQYPLHLLWTGAGILAAALLVLVSLSQARQHNLFGRAIVLQEINATQRLGGNRSGGHSAIRSFGTPGN